MHTFEKYIILTILFLIFENKALTKLIPKIEFANQINRNICLDMNTLKHLINSIHTKNV